jgi:hypothetical protein
VKAEISARAVATSLRKILGAFDHIRSSSDEWLYCRSLIVNLIDYLEEFQRFCRAEVIRHRDQQQLELFTECLRPRVSYCRANARRPDWFKHLKPEVLTFRQVQAFKLAA